MSEKIWYQDIRSFITETNYNKFFPSKDMTFVEQLNSLLRFSLYFSVVIFILRKDTNIFFVPIFMAGFTYLLLSVDTKNKVKERFFIDSKDMTIDKDTKKLCVKPTKDNPFMNVLISDYANNTQRKQACDISKPNVKKKVKQMFSNNLYRDVSDIYDKNASDRNYYTMPSTEIPNNQEAFAKYLYGQGKSCKDGNGNKCYSNLYRPVAY